MLPQLQIAAGVGCLFIVAYAWSYAGPKSFLSIASVGILIAGAFLFAGFVLGFIFCIPRTRPRQESEKNATAPKPEADVPSSLKGLIEDNNNLIEISDWLTKIIVGVGLVELKNIPSFLHRLTTYLGAGLGCDDSCAGVSRSETFALGIVLFFFAVGFLIGCIWTRSYFSSTLKALAGYVKDMDQSDKKTGDAEAIMRDAAKVDTLLRDATKADAAQGKAFPAEAFLREAADANSLLNRGLLDQALSVVDEALRLNPANAHALFTKARILRRQAGLAQLPGEPLDQKKMDEAIELTRAAARLLPGRGAPLYNLACYLALTGASRSEIFNNLRLAFELKPSLRITASADEDLRSIWKDAEFEQLTGRPPSPETAD